LLLQAIDLARDSHLRRENHTSVDWQFALIRKFRTGILITAATSAAGLRNASETK
jgi:hypothetical protein